MMQCVCVQFDRVFTLLCVHTEPQMFLIFRRILKDILLQRWFSQNNTYLRNWRWLFIQEYEYVFLFFFQCISFQWANFHICCMCDSYFNQLYLHSSVLLSLCLWRLSIACLHLRLLSFRILFFPPASPPSARSITCAPCASVRFRATRFMSEAAAPIARDTLTWWGEWGSTWRWLLPRVSLLPAQLDSPSLHTRVTLIYEFISCFR